LYILSANQGNARAQNVLGWCYKNGTGVTQDCKEAIRYLKLAADQGFNQAYYNLGICCRKGEGLTKDMKETIHYFTLATEKGNQYAPFSLGMIYKEGQDGIPKSTSEARKWFTIALEKGNEKAKGELEKLPKNAIEDQKHARRQYVTDFLAPLQLLEYVDAFLDAGYDDREAIIGIELDDLKEIKIKKGHQRKLLNALEALKTASSH